jgi:superoxide reductase
MEYNATMNNTLSSYVKSADWKSEKHVPVITAPEAVKAGEPFEVEVSVGKEIPHPNTLEHHIVWAALHFVPDGSQIPVELGRVGFSAHGPVATTSPTAKFSVAVTKAGTLFATSYCNIHGLWESSAAIALQ